MKMPPRILRTLEDYYREAHARHRIGGNADAWAKMMAKKIENRITTEVQLAEIGMVAFTVSGVTLEKFHRYSLMDENLLPEHIARMIKWGPEKKSNAIAPALVLNQAAAWLAKRPHAILVCHNWPFDAGLLSMLARKHNAPALLAQIKSHRHVDTTKLRDLRNILPDMPTKTWKNGKEGADNTQRALLARFNIRNPAEHTALEDAIALSKLTVAMIAALRA